MRHILQIKISKEQIFLTVWLAISITVTLFLLINLLSTTKESFEFDTDFLNFITGAKIVREGRGNELYIKNTQFETQREYFEDTEELTTILGFRSLPFVAIFLQPLVDLDFFTALKTFVVINILMLLGTIYLFERILQKHYKKYTEVDKTELLWTVALLLAFVPFALTNKSGQITPWLAIATGATFLFMLKNQDFGAGVSSAFLIIKPQYAILYPFLFILSKNRANFIKGLLLACFILVALGWAFMPWNYPLDYVKFLFASENLDYGTIFPQMSSLQGIYSHINIKYAFLLTKLTVGILYPIYMFLFLKRYKNIPFESAFVTAVLIAMSLSLHTYAMDHLMLFFPIIALTKIKKEVLAYSILFGSNLIFFNLHTLIPVYYLLIATYIVSAKQNTQNTM